MLGGAEGVRVSKVAETMRVLVPLVGQNRGGMVGDGSVWEVS